MPKHFFPFLLKKKRVRANFLVMYWFLSWIQDFKKKKMPKRPLNCKKRLIVTRLIRRARRILVKLCNSPYSYPQEIYTFAYDSLSEPVELLKCSVLCKWRHNYYHTKLLFEASLFLIRKHGYFNNFEQFAFLKRKY